MAYVGDGFSHDVFFSYAHGDDELRAWSLNLAELIGSTLRTSFADRAHELSLYVDPQVRGNEQLRPQLQEAAQSSAVQIVVMTGYYANSKWCPQEVKWFQDAVRTQEAEWAQALAGERRPGRVFVVRAQNVAGSLWPSLLLDGKETPTGYPCCDPVPLRDQGPWVRPWGLLDREDKQREAVGKLCDELALALYEMRRQNQKRLERRPSPAGDPARPRRPRVFVGFVTEDLEDERAAVRDLMAANDDIIEVVAPDRPADVDDIRGEVTALAADCSALVQVCGRGIGTWRVDSEGFVLHQVTQFEARRLPVLLTGVKWLQLDQLRATSSYANLLRTRDGAGKLPRTPPTAKEVVVAIEQARRRQAPAEPGALGPASLPECTVFVSSRCEYQTVELDIRERTKRQRRVSASLVPLRPITGRDPRELPELRRRRAAELDGDLLILAGHPVLEEDDFFELQKLRRQTSLPARLPVAVIDGVGGADPNYPADFILLRLTDTDFDAQLAAWLERCATRPRSDPAS